MIGLDTNVLVRFLVRDDEEQFQAAQRTVSALSSTGPGYLTTIVLVETFWVLTRGYRLDVADVIDTLTDVLERDEVVAQDEALVRRALKQTGQGADFADALIAQSCAAAGAGSVVTFDRTAARRLGMTLLQ